MIRHEPGSVVYVGAEDDVADTLRPRFEAMGADLSRVHILRGRHDEDGRVVPIDLDDLDVIEATVRAVGARLLVLDPIQAFLGAGVDMNRANQVRPLLAALARLAEELGVAVLVIRHLRKSGAGRALYAGLGSIDFSAAARSVLLAGFDPEREGMRVLAHAKCSTGPHSPSLAFEIRDGQFRWAGPSDVRAEDLCRETEPGRAEAIREAETWLREALAAGPVRSSELQDIAKRAGHHWRTVERAKKRTGVIARRVGPPGADGYWTWELPGGPEGGSDD